MFFKIEFKAFNAMKLKPELYKQRKFVLQSIFIAKNYLPGRLLLNVYPDLTLSYTVKVG